MEKLADSIVLGIALLAFRSFAQDAPAAKPVQASISDPNATYISADPNVPRYEIKALPYDRQIAAAKTYQELADIRNDILQRDDLSAAEKTMWIDAVSKETTRRIDADARLMRAKAGAEAVLTAAKISANPTAAIVEGMGQWIDENSAKIKHELLSPPTDGNLSKVSAPETCRDLATGLSREQKAGLLTMFQLADASYIENKDNVPKGFTPLSASELQNLVDTKVFTVDDEGFVTGAEGFAARIYRDDETGDLVLAYRGSEPNIDDWVKTDFGQLLGSYTTQYKLAEKLLGDLLEKTEKLDKIPNIHIPSHSLGCGLGSWAMLANELKGRVKGYFVNPAGLSDEMISRVSPGRIREAAENIINVRNESDIISMPGNHVGTTFTVANEIWKGDVAKSHGVAETCHNIVETMSDGYVSDALPRKTLEEELADISPHLANPDQALSHPVYTVAALIVNAAADAVADKMRDLGRNVTDFVVDTANSAAGNVSGFMDSLGNVLSTTWDWAKWQAVGDREMRNLLERTAKLYNQTPPAMNEGGCPCGAEAYGKVRDMVGNAWPRWQSAYGAVNGWKAVANASKAFGEGMGLVFKAMEPKQFGGIGSTILGRVNDFVLAHGETGNAGDALVRSQLGDVEKLAKGLQKLSSKSWDACKTAEERADYVQTVLDVRGEIRKLGDANGALSKIGLGSQELNALNGILKHTDTIAEVGQTWLDGYNAVVEAAKYFKNVSEALDVLDEMRMMVPAYEKVMELERKQVATCTCAEGCACAHCAKKKDDPNNKDDSIKDGNHTVGKIDTPFPSKSEKLYNDIWKMGEEYSSPPPPCKCGATCACNNARRANWEKAYADFKEKQKLAYDRLNATGFNEKVRTDYEDNEEKALIKAVNNLADAYTAGCDCPDPDPEPDPDPLPMPNIRDPNHQLAPQRIGGWKSKREKRYNDIWDEGEEYATQPPPCKCGLDCPCYRAKVERWAKAYEDFKNKQEAAYWMLQVIHQEGVLRRLQNFDAVAPYIPFGIGFGYGTTQLAKELIGLLRNAPDAYHDLMEFLNSEEYRDYVNQGVDFLKNAKSAYDVYDKVHKTIDTYRSVPAARRLVEIETEWNAAVKASKSIEEQIKINKQYLEKLDNALASEAFKIEEDLGRNVNVNGINSIREDIKNAETTIKKQEGELRRLASHQDELRKTFRQATKSARKLTTLTFRDLLPDFFDLIFLGYDLLRTDDDSIRGRNRQRDSLDRSYDTGEGRDLELAFARLKGIYNAPCKCPDPPPQIVLPPQQDIETDDRDWREKHPVWAWIVEHVLPEIVDVIFDWFRNHQEYSIENFFHIGEDGGCFDFDGTSVTSGNIWDIMRNRFPGIEIDGPPIVAGPDGPNVPTIPDPGDWTDFGDVVLTTVEIIAFPVLQQVLGTQLGKLEEKYPVIRDIFAALGIDSGSIMSTIRNIWGVLTGPGDLADKLRQLANDALEGIKKMLGNLIDWGLNKLKDWLANVVLGFFESSGSDKGFVADNPGKPDFLESVVQEILRLLAEQRKRGTGMTHIIRVDMPAGTTWSDGLQCPAQNEVWSGTVTAP